MLVVIHLGALGQSFISRLRRKRTREFCAQTGSARLLTELTEAPAALGPPTPPDAG